MAGTEPFGGKPDRGTTDHAAQGSDHGSAMRGRGSDSHADKAEGNTLAQAGQTLMDESRERFGEARGHLQSLMHQQTGRAADRLGNVAEALHMAAQKMAEENSDSTVARYTDDAASRVDGFANMLRDANIDDVIAEVEGFARRRPEVFVGAAMAAGFLFARFVKSADQPSRSRGLGLLGQHPDRSGRSDFSRSRSSFEDRSQDTAHSPAARSPATRVSEQQRSWDRPEAAERKPGHAEGNPDHAEGSPYMDRSTPASSGPGSSWTSTGAGPEVGVEHGTAPGTGPGLKTGPVSGGALRPAPAPPTPGGSASQRTDTSSGADGEHNTNSTDTPRAGISTPDTSKAPGSSGPSLRDTSK